MKSKLPNWLASIQGGGPNKLRGAGQGLVNEVEDPAVEVPCNLANDLFTRCYNNEGSTEEIGGCLDCWNSVVSDTASSSGASCEDFQAMLKEEAGALSCLSSGACISACQMEFERIMQCSIDSIACNTPSSTSLPYSGPTTSGNLSKSRVDNTVQLQDRSSSHVEELSRRQKNVQKVKSIWQNQPIFVSLEGPTPNRMSSVIDDSEAEPFERDYSSAAVAGVGVAMSAVAAAQDPSLTNIGSMLSEASGIVR